MNLLVGSLWKPVSSILWPCCEGWDGVAGVVRVGWGGLAGVVRVGWGGWGCEDGVAGVVRVGWGGWGCEGGVGWLGL